MLKNVKIENFHGIGEEVEISFEVSANGVMDESAREVQKNKYVNLVSCFIGHNASGKTTALKALSYLFFLVDNAYEMGGKNGEGLLLFQKHKLFSDKPTNITIEFADKGKFYQYKISLGSKEILSEYLGVNIKTGFSRIFEYKRNEKSWNLKLGQDLKIEKPDRDRLESLKAVPLLSALISLNYIKNITLFNGSTSNVSNIGKIPRKSFSPPFELFNELSSNEELKLEVLDSIKAIDLGISNFQFKDIKALNKNTEEEKSLIMMECIHRTDDKEFALTYLQESDGTQEAILLYSELLPVLKEGKIAIIDEIEEGLHPYVVKKIIKLFESKRTNPHGAQLLFSTHQHLLLNDRTKSQIFLCEKDSEKQQSDIYRLDDVEGVRNDENYFQKYLAGTYGAVPDLNWG